MKTIPPFGFALFLLVLAPLALVFAAIKAVRLPFERPAKSKPSSGYPDAQKRS